MRVKTWATIAVLCGMVAAAYASVYGPANVGIPVLKSPAPNNSFCTGSGVPKACCTGTGTGTCTTTSLKPSVVVDEAGNVLFGATPANVAVSNPSPLQVQVSNPTPVQVQVTTTGIFHAGMTNPNGDHRSVSGPFLITALGTGANLEIRQDNGADNGALRASFNSSALNLGRGIYVPSGDILITPSGSPAVVYSGIENP